MAFETHRRPISSKEAVMRKLTGWLLATLVAVVAVSFGFVSVVGVAYAQEKKDDMKDMKKDGMKKHEKVEKKTAKKEKMAEKKKNKKVEKREEKKETEKK